MTLWTKQTGHFLSLAILLVIIWLTVNNFPRLTFGNLFGIPAESWLLLGILVPIVHQLFVWFTWRMELVFQSISKRYGAQGFEYYKTIFLVLFILRPVSVLCLAMANSDTLGISKTTGWVMGILFLIPALYLIYSVKRYFGLDRALGKDHFEPESFKDKELVKKGIFRYTNNGMYVFGFFMLWAIAFLFRSEAALLVAAFNHIYIWVHYVFTEKPDMKFIYGQD